MAISLNNASALTKIIIGAVREEASLAPAETEISKLLPANFTLMSQYEQEKIIYDISKNLGDLKTNQLQAKLLVSPYSHVFLQYESLAEVKANLKILVPDVRGVPMMRDHYREPVERHRTSMDEDEEEDITDLDDTESIYTIGRGITGGSTFPVGRAFPVGRGEFSESEAHDVLISASISVDQVRRVAARISKSVSSHI